MSRKDPVINLQNYCVHNIQIYPKQNLKLPCCNFANVFTVFNGVNVSVGGSQIRETEKTFYTLAVIGEPVEEKVSYHRYGH